MSILAIIQLVGRHWQLVAGFVLAAVSFGYGYSMASDKCARDNQAVIIEYQKHANEQAKDFEIELARIDKNRRKVYHAKSSNPNCIVTANGVQRINGALANDTSKFN
jgi:hypothetical protein